MISFVRHSRLLELEHPVAGRAEAGTACLLEMSCESIENRNQCCFCLATIPAVREKLAFSKKCPTVNHGWHVWNDLASGR